MWLQGGKHFQKASAPFVGNIWLYTYLVLASNNTPLGYYGSPRNKACSFHLDFRSFSFHIKRADNVDKTMLTSNLH